MSSHLNTPQIVPPSSLENTNKSTTESTTESKTDFVDKLVNVTGNELANLIFLKYFASKCPDTEKNNDLNNSIITPDNYGFVEKSENQLLLELFGLRFKYEDCNNKYQNKFNSTENNSNKIQFLQQDATINVDLVSYQNYVNDLFYLAGDNYSSAFECQVKAHALNRRTAENDINKLKYKQTYNSLFYIWKRCELDYAYVRRKRNELGEALKALNKPK